jgi:hypothetical protein
MRAVGDGLGAEETLNEDGEESSDDGHDGVEREECARVGG